MRIFVTAPDDTGTLRKTRLTLVDCTTSNDLLKRLSSLCHIHQQWIIAKIKQDLVINTNKNSRTIHTEEHNPTKLIYQNNSPSNNIFKKLNGRVYYLSIFKKSFDN